jgi:hypothetical protein
VLLSPNGDGDLEGWVGNPGTHGWLSGSGNVCGGGAGAGGGRGEGQRKMGGM